MDRYQALAEIVGATSQQQVSDAMLQCVQAVQLLCLVDGISSSGVVVRVDGIPRRRVEWLLDLFAETEVGKANLSCHRTGSGVELRGLEE